MLGEEAKATAVWARLSSWMRGAGAKGLKELQDGLEAGAPVAKAQAARTALATLSEAKKGQTKPETLDMAGLAPILERVVQRKAVHTTIARERHFLEDRVVVRGKL